MKKIYEEPDIVYVEYDTRKGATGYICSETASEVLGNRRGDEVMVDEGDDVSLAEWGEWWNED